MITQTLQTPSFKIM